MLALELSAPVVVRRTRAIGVEREGSSTSRAVTLVRGAGSRRALTAHLRNRGSSAPRRTPTLRRETASRARKPSFEGTGARQRIFYEEMHPYGSSAYRSAPSATQVSARRYRYTGKERDEETGLDYFGARYYAPWLGRWTTADPLGLQAGVNLFLYARGSPIVMVDPNGMESVYLGHSTAPQDTARFDKVWGEGAREWRDTGNSSTTGWYVQTEGNEIVRTEPKAEPAPDFTGHAAAGVRGLVELDRGRGSPMSAGSEPPLDPLAHLPTPRNRDPGEISEPGEGTEVFFWDAVGLGAASFGHVSVAIGETSYSFGPRGVAVQPREEYLQSELRSGGVTGLELDLTASEEAQLKNAFESYGEEDYDAVFNNCGDPVEGTLREVYQLPAGTFTPEGLYRQMKPQATRENRYEAPKEPYKSPWGTRETQNRLDHPFVNFPLFRFGFVLSGG